MISPLAFLGELFRIIATKIDRIEVTFTNLFYCDFVNNEYASFALKDLTELSLNMKITSPQLLNALFLG